MENFRFIRGVDADTEDGSYLCLAICSNVIGASSIKKAFGDDAEKSAIEDALLELSKLQDELKDELQKYK
jgi:hypothetical protein